MPWAVCGVGAAVLVLATGCTGGSTAPSASATTPSGHLLWWDISNLAGAPAADRSLVDGFVKANPEVSVEVVVMTPDEAHGKFDTAAQTAAVAPDVITVDSSWIPDWSARGYLARLDDTVAVDGAQDVFTSLLPMEKYDGRLMAAVRSADGLALLYNKSVLAKAGIGVPRTWADVAAAKLKLTAQGVQTLYAPATGYGLLPWIYGEGGSLVDAEAKIIEVSQPAAVAGLANRVDLQATGVTVDDTGLWSSGTTPPNQVTTLSMRSAFRNGQVAMIMDNASSLSLLVGGPAFSSTSQIGIATVPSGSVRSSGPVSGTAYAVFSGSHNLLAAYKFVQYAQSPASQATLAVELGLLPSRLAAYAEPQVAADPVIAAFEPVIMEGTPLPQVQPQSSLLFPLDDSLRSALLGDLSATAALDAVAAQYEKTLNSGYTIGPPPS
jgi:arabinogalactan oligomer/maltooligosaccharide transport system substrate-binding protein